MKAVFQKTSSRKVVVSTNIGESSLTLDNCEVVIDFCMTKQNHYNHVSKLERLVTSYASQASCK